MPIEIYTDGSSLNNPGASGLAYIIKYWIDNDNEEMPIIKTIEANQGFRLSTNNRMEIMSAIYGLKKIIELINTDEAFKDFTQINLFTDSQYLSSAINNRWLQSWRQRNWMTSGFGGKAPTAVKNKDLWEQVIELQDTLHNMSINLTITHVKGHNGNEFNEKADKLAVAASNDTVNHQIDEYYEKNSNIMNKRNYQTYS